MINSKPEPGGIYWDHFPCSEPVTPWSPASTGCCLNGRTAQPPSKSLIFWSFPNVLCLFDSSIWAIFIQVFLGHRIEKKSEKSHPQKSFNFSVGANWHISLFLIFWFFCPQLPSKPSKLKCGGSFGKFREFAAR